MSNIYPIDNISREEKESLLGHKGIVIWMYGLSGSGKSTLAKLLERKLYDEGIHTKLLDGDNIRSGINNNLGFEEADRIENNRRAAEVAKLFLDNGEVVICSFITPTNYLREKIREIIGSDFKEIFIKASFNECAKRDTKGLYKRALDGEIENFTGLDSPFEEPSNPFLVLDTENESIDTCLEMLYNAVIKVIRNETK
jgi:adenylylsulfate kinase